MKKLLLKFAALALFALSPHAPGASAQTSTGHMDFDPRTADHNADMYMYKGLQQTVNSKTYTLGAKEQWFDESQAKPFVNQSDYNGLGRIENSDICLDFNYENLLVSATNSTPTTRVYRYNTFSLSPRSVTTSNGTGIYMYAGTKMLVRSNNPQKVIKRIILKTPIESANMSNIQFQKNFNIYDSFESTTRTDKANVSYSTYSGKNASGATATCVQLTIDATSLFGLDGLVIAVPQTGTHITTVPQYTSPGPANTEITAQNLILAQNTSVATSASNYQIIKQAFSKRFSFAISSIDIEYLDKDEIPPYLASFGGYASEVEHWNETTGAWERPTAETIYHGDVEKLRMGNVIAEFKKPTTYGSGASAATQATVTVNPIYGRIGIHRDVTVRAYLDKYPMYKDAETKPLMVTYNKYGLDASSQYSLASWYGSRLTRIKSTEGTNIKLTDANQTTQPVIAKLSNLYGIEDDLWLYNQNTITTFMDYIVNTKTGNNDIKSGAKAYLWFDNIVVNVAATEPATPIRPHISDPLRAQRDASGAWIFNGNTSVTVTLDDDNYPEADFYYTLSNTPVADGTFDITKAKKADGNIVITEDDLKTGTVLSAVAVAAVDGKQKIGQVQSMTFKSAGVTAKFTNYKDLNKAENDGKIVSLDFPINVFAAAYGSGTDNKNFYIYGWDYDHNPIKIVDMENAASSKRTKLAKITKPGGPSNETKDKVMMLEASHVVGKFFYNNGHPEIRIADMRADAPEQYDYTQYLPPTYTTGNNEVFADKDLLKIFPMDVEYAREFSPALYGKEIRIRPATCTEVVTAKTEYKFKLGDKEFKMLRSLSADYCSTNPADFVAGEEYSIRGFFDYDGTDYVFVPYKAVFAVQTPKPEDIVIKDSDGNTIEHYATTAEGVDLEVMMNLYVKKITFELPAAYTSDAAKAFTYKNGKHLFLNTSGSNLNNAGQSSLAVVKTINLTSMPTFEEGTDYGDIKLVITNLYSATSFTEDVSDTIVIRVHDKVCTAPAFGSFAELRKAVKDDPSLIGEFVRVTNPNIAVAAINNNKPTTGTAYKNEINSLLLKDISPLKEGKDADDLECLPLTTTDLLNKYKVSYNDYRGNNLWQRYTRDVQVGDSIGSVTFVVKLDDNGNLIGDLTNLSDQNYFKSGAWNSYRSDTPNYQQAANPNYQSGTARFSHLVEQMNRVITVEKPAETTLGEAQTDRMVTLSDVAIVNTAADGDDPVYAAVTASNVPLQWDVFVSTTYTTSSKKIIQARDASATYNICGMLRSDGKGGHVIEVTELLPSYAKVFAVCSHPEHDSYIDKQLLTDDLVGEAILIRGVKLAYTKSSPYVYTAELKEAVTLDFTTMSTQQSTWCTAIRNDRDALMDDTKYPTKSYYNISGKLIKDDDGNYKIDLYTFQQVTGTAIKTSIFANGTSSVARVFYGHSFPNITLLNNNNAPIKGAEEYKFYYTAVEAPSDVVRARKEAGETIDEIAADLLKDAEEKVYDPENRPEFTESYFMSAYSCTPGDVAPAAITHKYIEKSSLTTGKLADLVAADYSYNAISDNTPYTNNYYVSSPLRVVEVNPEYGYMALTDGEKIIGARRGATITTGIKAGDYINDLGMYRKWHKNFYHINSEVEYLNPADAPATEIKVPEAVVLGADLAAEAGTMVKIPVARISKVDGEYMVSYADEAATPVALADDSEADASSPVALPLTSHLGWNPEDIDETAEYIVHGVAIYRTTLSDPNNPVIDPNTGSPTEASPETGKLEIWATSVELRGQTPAPVITVSGAESVEDGKAVTIEDVTVSIACEEATAKIEYSTDGGNTWIAYDDTKPVVIKTTTTVAARAQGEDMSMSPVATMEIVRETVSGKAAIDFAPKAGYTEVTLRHEAIDFAGKYEVRYTTDGSEPTADSQLYTAPLELEEACTVKAILKEEGKDRFGAVVSQAITVRSGDLKITATRAPGKTTVRIEVADTKHFNADGAVICYSKNDGATFEEYQVKDGKNYVEFETDKAITVVAYLEEQGKTIGEEVAEDITVDPVTTEPTDPTDPTDPTPAKSGKVTITATEGDGVTYVELAPESQLAAGSYAIHYTLDGSEPTAASTKHDGNRIEVRKACTIKAVLIENGKTAGEVAVKQIAVTGIDGIAADGASKVTVEGDCIVAPEGSMVFDMTGRRVRPEGLRAGIYIVRLADGTAVKVAVR